MTNKLTLREFILITVGSLLYAVSTNLFIFPSGVIIGGTSGISVILAYVLDFSPGTIITVINIALILLAFLLLGKDMAIKTLVGSVLTTIFIGGLEKPLALPSPLIESKLLSALVGAAMKERCAELGIGMPRIALEPGRSIVADAGLTLYTAGTRKEIKGSVKVSFLPAKEDISYQEDTLEHLAEEVRSMVEKGVKEELSEVEKVVSVQGVSDELLDFARSLMGRRE